MRVLFVAGEVAPFSETTDTAQAMRVLPEALQEHQDVEPRILMPRYGVVSERRNRLHEVIRLSGAEITAGDATDTLKVKVASIPGIRLQVYFMDSVHFFKRKGLYRERKTEVLFEDNPARALFFARAALSTVGKLGWGPDVVHAAGWIGALVPHVIKTELADSELFANARTVYTPDPADAYNPTMTEDEAKPIWACRPTGRARRSARSASPPPTPWPTPAPTPPPAARPQGPVLVEEPEGHSRAGRGAVPEPQA